MFDSIFNLIFVLIPISILIGRGIVQARAKHAPPPPMKPVHFEEEVELPPTAEALSQDRGFRPMETAREPEPPPKQVPGPKRTPKPEIKEQIAPLPAALAANLPNQTQPPQVRPLRPIVCSAPPRTQTVFLASPGQVNLSHLTPLQQAVVMAEILGPPKGML